METVLNTTAEGNEALFTRGSVSVLVMKGLSGILVNPAWHESTLASSFTPLGSISNVDKPQSVK